MRREPRLMFGSLAGYQRSWLRRDLLAGLVLAAVLVPQGMAYAELAGLSPVTGLYASMLPLVAYAVFGSSRQLVVAPESSTSALVAATLVSVVAESNASAASVAAGLAIATGVLCVLGSILRLGFLGDLLSGPVFVGYLNGLAVIILVSQLPKAFGYSAHGDTFVAEVQAVARGIGQAQVASVVIASSVLAGIVVLRRVLPAWPGVLIMVGLSAVVVKWLDLSVATVGAIPSGLPSVALPGLGWSQVVALLPAAAAIAAVSFADTIVESRTFAARNHYQVDANRDLAGLGAADIASGLCGAFPLSSSASRTAVAEAAGGHSQVTNLVAAACVAMVALWLTGPLAAVPQPALAAVVFFAAARLIDVRNMRRLLTVRRADFAVAVTTLLGVLFIGILPGVLIAISLSVLNVVRRAMRPADAVLGRLPDQGGFHNVTRHDGVETVPGLVVFRFEAPLFFGNAEHFAERLHDVVRDVPGTRWLVLDAGPLSDVDTTAADVLLREIDAFDREGVTLAFARTSGAVRDMLDRNGVLAAVGEDRMFPSIREAIEAYVAATDRAA